MIKIGLFRIRKIKREENDLIEKASMADNVLSELGVEKHTETGKQIRAAIAMELLGSKFDMIDKYSKGVFIKNVGSDGLKQIMSYLQEAGLLTKKGIKQLEKKE